MSTDDGRRFDADEWGVLPRQAVLGTPKLRTPLEQALHAAMIQHVLCWLGLHDWRIQNQFEDRCVWRCARCTRQEMG